MSKIIKAPNNFLNLVGPTVFLAGTIDNGASEDWQLTATKYLKNYANVLNPRRDDWNKNLSQTRECLEFYRQVNWELDAINRANHVLFNFLPDSMSPVTMLELGLCAAKKGSTDKVIVCCPKEFWRSGNIEIVCERYGIILFETLDEGLKYIRSLCY